MTCAPGPSSWRYHQRAVGVTDRDVVQITFELRAVHGVGSGCTYGAERVGAFGVPGLLSAIPGVRFRYAGLLHDGGLVGFSSYALPYRRGDEGWRHDRSSLTLRSSGPFRGEPSSEHMRKKLEESLGIMATDNLRAIEVLGPGVPASASASAGCTINEDHFIADVIDPQTLEPVPYGREGELVLTTPH